MKWLAMQVSYLWQLADNLDRAKTITQAAKCVKSILNRTEQHRAKTFNFATEILIKPAGFKVVCLV